MSKVVKWQRTSQPQGVVALNPALPKPTLVFNPGMAFRDIIQNYQGSLSGGATKINTALGAALSLPQGSGVNALPLNPNPDNVFTNNTEATIVLFRRRTNLTNVGSTSFGYSNGTDRVLAHTPWSDGEIYFDFGGNTGSYRVAVGGQVFDTNPDGYVFVASAIGPGRREIYRRGKLIAANNGSLGRSSVTTVPFSVGDAGNFGTLDEEIYLLVVYPYALHSRDCLLLSKNPWRVFAPDHRNSYVYQPRFIPATITQRFDPKRQRTNQPQGVVEVDWGNPLSEGLTGLWNILNTGVSKNAVNSNATTDEARGISTKSKYTGRNWYSETTILPALGTTNSLFDLVNNAFTIVILTKRSNGTTGERGGVYSLPGLGGMVLLPASGISASMFQVNSRGGGPFIATTDGFVTNFTYSNTPHLLAITSDGTTANAYQNAKLTNSVTSYGKTIPSGQNFKLGGCSGWDSFFGTDSDVYAVATYRRALSASEVASLAGNPWQVFAPDHRNSYVYALDPTTIITLILANLAQSHTLQTLALTQANTLSTNALAQAQIADNISLAQQHVLSVQGELQSQVLDNATLTISTVLTVLAETQGQTLDNASLTQQNTLTINSEAQAQTLENASLTQQNTLVVSPESQAQTLDNAALTQQSTLQVNAENQAQTLETPSLTQQVTLSVNAESQAQVLENVGLTQQNILIVNAANQLQTLESVVLSSAGALSVNALSQAQALGNLSLIQQNILAVAAQAQGQVLDAVSLAQQNQLIIAGLQQAQVLGSVALDFSVALSVNSAAQAQVLGSISLVQQNILSLNALGQSQALDALGLQQAYVLAVQALVQTHSLGVLTLDFQTVLSIGDINQNVSLGNVALVQANILSVLAQLQGQTLSSITLGSESTLVINNLLHTQITNNIQLLSGVVELTIAGDIVYILNSSPGVFIMRSDSPVFIKN